LLIKFLVTVARHKKSHKLKYYFLANFSKILTKIYLKLNSELISIKHRPEFFISNCTFAYYASCSGKRSWPNTQDNKCGERMETTGIIMQLIYFKNPDEINNTALQAAKHFQHKWNPPTTKYTCPCFYVSHKGNGLMLLIYILYRLWKTLWFMYRVCTLF
jgi:hypothetical protein